MSQTRGRDRGRARAPGSAARLLPGPFHPASEVDYCDPTFGDDDQALSAE